MRHHCSVVMKILPARKSSKYACVSKRRNRTGGRSVSKAKFTRVSEVKCVLRHASKLRPPSQFPCLVQKWSWPERERHRGGWRKSLQHKAEGVGLEPTCASLRAGFQDRCLTIRLALPVQGSITRDDPRRQRVQARTAGSSVSGVRAPVITATASLMFTDRGLSTATRRPSRAT